MTRWTAYILLPNNKCIFTVEFNWDMYIEDWSNWKMMLKTLDQIKDEKSGIELLNKFNRDTFQYKEKITHIDNVVYKNENELHYKKYFVESSINTQDSFWDWFSDYIFIKNLSWKDIKVFWDESICLVSDWEIIVVNFWTIVYEHWWEEIWRKDDSWELRELDDDNFVNDDVDNEHIAQMIERWFTQGDLTWWCWWVLKKSR